MKRRQSVGSRDNACLNTPCGPLVKRMCETPPENPISDGFANGRRITPFEESQIDLHEEVDRFKIWWKLVLQEVGSCSHSAVETPCSYRNKLVRLAKALERVIWGMRLVIEDEKEPSKTRKESVEMLIVGARLEWDILSETMKRPKQSSGWSWQGLRSVIRGDRSFKSHIETLESFEVSLQRLFDALGSWTKEMTPPNSDKSKTQKKNKTHAMRTKRWHALGAILSNLAQRQKKESMVGFSSITWEEVKTVLETSEFTVPVRDFDDGCMAFLMDHMELLFKCLGHPSVGSDAKRLYFIAPIIFCVCSLLEGVTVVVEEDLKGKRVQAQGRFELMLKRKNKVVCIIEAKKDDMVNGKAQNLVGCEVAADVGNLDVVCGVVTTFIHWQFLRSENCKIFCEDYFPVIHKDRPATESLKEIVGKLYTMLSDDVEQLSTAITV